MLKSLAFFGCVALAGCASQIMERYVGQDLAVAVVDYGPPAAQFEMPDGRTAFQWVMSSTYVSPVTTTYNANTYGGMTTGSMMTTGGVPYSQTCRYTAYAEQRGERWIITGFEQPSFWCN